MLDRLPGLAADSVQVIRINWLVPGRSGDPAEAPALLLPELMKHLIVAAGVTLVVAASVPVHPDGQAAPAQSGSPAQGAKAPALTPDALDRLLAPIALYPDQLLAQMLLSATNPGRVAALAEWLASNQTLKGGDLQDAAVKSGFDTSFVALVVFPDVVQVMAGQPDWTRQLGQAFSDNRTAVFESIQRLRAKARSAGTLKSTPQQDVETRTTSSGQQVIVIEPANPQVVYVPQYNPQVVYTQPTSSTVVVQQQSSSSDAVAAGLIGFTAGIAIGAAVDNNYYYGPYGWRGGAYMYNDAWDDWYDDREDMREDWQDNREDLMEERGDRREDLADERGDRAGTQAEQRSERQQNRPEAQAQREQRRSESQRTGTAAPTTSGTSQEARGYSREKTGATQERSGTRSDAFSGYSNGKSERAASSRGERSRSRSGGGGRRR
jgi:Protein of unknown function (DUF3300)